MGHYGGGYGGYADPRINEKKRRKLVGVIRRNRKKIILVLAVLVITAIIVGILVVYLVFSLLLKGKDAVLNPNTINQVQNVATQSGKLIPQTQNGWIQNFSWIINIINTLQNLGG